MQHQLLLAGARAVTAGPGVHPLDQQPAAAGQGAAVLALTFEVVHQRIRRRRIEPTAFAQLGMQRRAFPCGEPRVGLVEKAADVTAEVVIAVDRLGAPERRRRYVASGGVHQHVVVGDAVDAPVGGAEIEGLTDGCFPHELFVQLADHLTAAGVAQFVVAAIRNGAAGVVQREHRAALGFDAIGYPIEAQPRLQIAQAQAGVAPGEHLQHRIEVRALQLVIGR